MSARRTGAVLCRAMGLVVGVALPAWSQAPTPLLPPALPPNAAQPAPMPAPAVPLPGAAPPIRVPGPDTSGAAAPASSSGAATAPGGQAGAPGVVNPANPGLSASGHPLPPPTPPPPPPSWVSATHATVQVLDKVTGRAATLSIAVGAKAGFKALSVMVRACDTRPPDQAPDSTALLNVSRADASAPIFVGWMLAAEPTAAMISDPVYDVRLLACQ